MNNPAIQLYVRNGFVKADGICEEVFDDGFVLREYGYEIKNLRYQRGQKTFCPQHHNIATFHHGNVSI